MKHHLVYKIINKMDGKYYIGIHSTDNIEDGYMGSGKLFRIAIEEYGEKNFEKEILFDFVTRKQSLTREAELVKQNEVDNKDCYNIALGGNDPMGQFKNKVIKYSFKKKSNHLYLKLDLTILRTIRKSKGLKLNDIASKLGISSSYLSTIENNKKNPKITIIENICKELGYELRIIPK